MSVRILISGSVAYDTIMVFDGHFKDHILPDRVHMLNVAFLTPQRNLVLLVLNRTDRAQTCHVEAHGRVFPVTLDRGSVATLVVPAQ